MVGFAALVPTFVVDPAAETGYPLDNNLSGGLEYGNYADTNFFYVWTKLRQNWIPILRSQPNLTEERVVCDGCM